MRFIKIWWIILVQFLQKILTALLENGVWLLQNV